MKTRILLYGVVFVVVVFLISVAVAEEWVKFEGRMMTGDKLELTGILSKPNGDGPFPTVIMLCGCGGLKNKEDFKQQNAWAARLMSWGYASLIVDSFGPRNYDCVADNGYKVNATVRSFDAYSARSYLSKLNYVDSKNLAVMGWSHGGCTVMRIVDRQSRPKDSQPFQVAIAFYPYCDYLYELDTPLLILCGEKDDDLPSSLCLKLDELGPTKKSLYEINLKIYPNAYHCFDFEGLSKDELGHHYEYNPEAAADAIIQTRDFLAKYFKTKM